jgi:hypothetical protein
MWTVKITLLPGYTYYSTAQSYSDTWRLWIEITDHFSPEELEVATKSIEWFIARAVWLYEQKQEEPLDSPLVGPYVERWVRWLYGGVTLCAFDVTTPSLFVGLPYLNA